jgi:putative acetyltransferase
MSLRVSGGGEARVSSNRIRIRRMRSGDACAYLQVQRAAVRWIAAKDYPPAVIEQWAPLPITEGAIAEVRANRENEIRLLAEIDDEIVGMGAIIPARNELRACYVAPQAAGRGVGSAIVRQIERIARQHGLTWLELDASVTSEKFYAGLGYEVRWRGEHILNSDQSMACVKMRKGFSPRSP